MREIIGVILMIAGLLFLGSLMGYSTGYSKGMQKAQEISEQVTCEMDWGNKPLSEVPVECLKWFDIKQK